MGGSSPPVKAMFTLKPTPAPVPTYNTRTTGLLCLHKFTQTGGQAGRETDWCSFPPRQVLHCQGRSSHHRSDAVTGRGHWGLCRRPAGCRYHGEHPENIKKGQVRAKSHTECGKMSDWNKNILSIISLRLSNNQLNTNNRSCLVTKRTSDDLEHEWDSQRPDYHLLHLHWDQLTDTWRLQYRQTVTSVSCDVKKGWSAGFNKTLNFKTSIKWPHCLYPKNALIRWS